MTRKAYGFSTGVRRVLLKGSKNKVKYFPYICSYVSIDRRRARDKQDTCT